MRFVADSNVLFTFFWKNSVFEDILSREEVKLFSPEFALEEINKYSSEIMKKTGLERDEFLKRKKELTAKVKFIPLEIYADSLKQAEHLMKTFPEEHKKEFLDDIDFFTLALKLGCQIWTNDKLFKKQSRISALTTKEMMDILS